MNGGDFVPSNILPLLIVILCEEIAIMHSQTLTQTQIILAHLSQEIESSPLLKLKFKLTLAHLSSYSYS